MRRMRFLSAALLAWCGALPALAADYVPADKLRETGWRKSWQIQLPLEAGQRLSAVYLVDDQLYLPTEDGYVFAVHAETGATRWLRPVSTSGYPIRRPAHAGNRTIFAIPTMILQVNRLNGEGLAKQDLRFPAGTAPVSDGERIFVGGLDQRIYAFEIGNPYRGWKAVTAGPIVSTPTLFQEILYLASSDGSIYACTAPNKRLHWAAPASLYGSVTADLVVDGNGVYVACQDRSLYLLDLLFGRTRWRARFPGPLYEPPVLTDELAFQYCPGDGVSAVEIAQLGIDERIRWKAPRGRRLLTQDEQGAALLGLDQNLLFVRVADGKVLHEVAAPGMTLGDASLATPAIYMASTDGRVFCARPENVPLVTAQEVREALFPPEGEGEAIPELGPPVTGAPREEPDYLGTTRQGPPIGGRSKVTREFGGGGGR